jgi:bifunctional DNA-binding transcriptional regulator/antitoxin component of YhaV-PrlF toxin-antitoxin module
MNKTYTRTISKDGSISLPKKVVKLLRVKPNDQIKFVDNMDGSLMLMSDFLMEDGYVEISKLESGDMKRYARLYICKSKDHYIVDMYENSRLTYSRKISGTHTQNYVEDCAENWILKCGEFKNESNDTK